MTDTATIAERLRGLNELQRLWDASVAAVDAYNTRLRHEREIGSFPPRLGNLWEEAEAAKRAWTVAAQDFVSSRAAERAAAEIARLTAERDEARAAWSAFLNDNPSSAWAKLRAAEAELARLKQAVAERDAELDEFMLRLDALWFLAQNWFPQSVSDRAAIRARQEATDAR